MKAVLFFVILSLALAACSPSAEVAPPIAVATANTPRPVATSGGSPTTAPTNAPNPTAAPIPAQTASYPAPTQTNIGAVYEPFERGFMIYLSDRKQIWVFMRASLNNPNNAQVNFGQWLAYPDTYKDGEPETDPSLSAPTRLLQPKRGFGKVWRENAAVRNGIGWALEWEQNYNANLTTYPIGTLEGGKFNQKFAIHIITTMDNSIIHVNEATYVWSKQ